MREHDKGQTQRRIDEGEADDDEGARQGRRPRADAAMRTMWEDENDENDVEDENDATEGRRIDEMYLAYESARFRDPSLRTANPP